MDIMYEQEKAYFFEDCSDEKGKFMYQKNQPQLQQRPAGSTAKALAYGARDCGFESHVGLYFFFLSHHTRTEITEPKVFFSTIFS